SRSRHDRRARPPGGVMTGSWLVVILSACGALGGAALGVRAALYLPKSDLRPLYCAVVAIVCGAMGYLLLPAVVGLSGAPDASEAPLASASDETEQTTPGGREVRASDPATEAPHLVSSPAPVDREPKAARPSGFETADSSIDLLFANPLIDAIAAAEPDRRDEFESRVRQAHKENGADGARSASADIGQEAAAAVFNTYVPKAAGDDLVDLLSTLADITEFLASEAPRICHNWLYSARTGEDFDAPLFIERIGRDRETRLNQALAAIVLGAGDEAAAIDETKVSRVLSGAGVQVLATLGEDRIGLITEGESPETEEDARAACDATELMYRYVLFEPEAPNVIRALFSGEQVN
ncbi:MAG: hypothetical protein AAGL49_02415, partial [Pseudomonadota bacterium]